jgi:hypothetical protein
MVRGGYTRAVLHPTHQAQPRVRTHRAKPRLPALRVQEHHNKQKGSPPHEIVCACLSVLPLGSAFAAGASTVHPQAHHMRHVHRLAPADWLDRCQRISCCLRERCQVTRRSPGCQVTRRSPGCRPWCPCWCSRALAPSSQELPHLVSSRLEARRHGNEGLLRPTSSKSWLSSNSKPLAWLPRHMQRPPPGAGGPELFVDTSVPQGGVDS